MRVKIPSPLDFVIPAPEPESRWGLTIAPYPLPQPIAIIRPHRERGGDTPVFSADDSPAADQTAGQTPATNGSPRKPDLDSLRATARSMRRNILNMITEANSGPPRRLALRRRDSGVPLLPHHAPPSLRPGVAGARPLRAQQGARLSRALRRARRGGLLRRRRADDLPQDRQPPAGPRPHQDARRGDVRRLARARVFRSAWAPRSPPGWTVGPPAPTCCSATASATRARFGKPPCPRPTTRSTTWSP